MGIRPAISLCRWDSGYRVTMRGGGGTPHTPFVSAVSRHPPPPHLAGGGSGVRTQMPVTDIVMPVTVQTMPVTVQAMPVTVQVMPVTWSGESTR